MGCWMFIMAVDQYIAFDMVPMLAYVFANFKKFKSSFTVPEIGETVVYIGQLIVLKQSSVFAIDHWLLAIV